MTPSRRRGPSWPRKLLYSLLCTLASAVLAEGVATVVWGDVHATYWIVESPPDAFPVAYDPVRGYRLGSDGVRFGYVDGRGSLATWGAARGNSQGFADPDEWGPQRESPHQRRVAVFGDSMTAGLFLQRAWPDLVEDMAAADGADLQLLNLSLDGGGLANWWSVATRLLEPGAYDLDGVIFAVCGDDLHRGFTFGDTTPSDLPTAAAYGRIPMGRSRQIHATVQEARANAEGEWSWGAARPHDFDSLIRGEPLPAFDESRRELFLTSLVRRGLPRLRSDLRRVPPCVLPGDGPALTGTLEPVQLRMAADLADYLRRNDLPAVILRIPTLDEVLAPTPIPPALQEFALTVEAPVYDGVCAFEGVPVPQARNAYLRGDGHWTQAGSDRFAAFVAEQLAGTF